MLSGDSNENSPNKKQLCTCSTLFLCIEILPRTLDILPSTLHKNLHSFFAVVLHDYNVKLLETS